MPQPRQHRTNAARQAAYRQRQRIARLQTTEPPLVFPSPYWGGKRHIAPLVWERLGAVKTYIEPFGGSLAMLWARPRPLGGREIVNDVDGLLVNLYRAIRFAPREVAAHAAWPVHELDLQARSDTLCARREALTARVQQDPWFYDAELAGWLLWGLSSTTAAGFATRVGLHPHPHISHTGSGLQSQHGRTRLPILLHRLAARLARVVTLCGDWRRAVTDSVLLVPHTTPVAVFLDPPYTLARRHKQLYACDREGLAAAVRQWALAHGGEARLRIALCGLPEEHEMPAGWSALEWEARGGLKNTSTQGRGQGKTRAEVVWFSPACLPPAQGCLLP